jgi:hypothetical protein
LNEKTNHDDRKSDGWSENEERVRSVSSRKRKKRERRDQRRTSKLTNGNRNHHVDPPEHPGQYNPSVDSNRAQESALYPSLSSLSLSLSTHRCPNAGETESTIMFTIVEKPIENVPRNSDCEGWKIIAFQRDG